MPMYPVTVTNMSHLGNCRPVAGPISSEKVQPAREAKASQHNRSPVQNNEHSPLSSSQHPQVQLTCHRMSSCHLKDSATRLLPSYLHMQGNSLVHLQGGSDISMQTLHTATQAGEVTPPKEKPAMDEGADLLDIIGAANLQ